MARKRGDGPGADFAARMVMERRDGQLHAEGKQREQNKPDAESRCGHDLRPSYRYSEFDCSCVTIVADEYPPPHSYPHGARSALGKMPRPPKNWNHCGLRAFDLKRESLQPFQDDKKKIVNTDPPGRAGRLRQAKFLGQLIVFPPLSLRAVAYLVCLGFLIPALGLAAYLLSAVHSEELTALQADARTRALLAANFVDDQMDTLLRTLKALPAEDVTQNSQSHIRTELDRKGIVLFTRSEKLDVLSPIGGLSSGRITLDGASRSAAAAALSKQAPQITAYDDAQDKGIDVWLAAASSDAKPVLIQARVPSAFLASALKKFAAGGPW